jgi:hypothetical protein
MSRLEHPVSEEELMAYADGQLQGHAVQELTEHVRQCPDCAAALAGFRSLSRKMASWQIEEPAVNVTERVLEEMNALPPKKPWWAFSLRSYAVAGVFLVAISLLFATLVIPSLLRSRQADATVTGGPVILQQGSVNALRRRFEGPQGQQGQQGQQQQQGQAGRPAQQEEPVTTGPMVIRSIKLTLVTREFDTARSKINAIVVQSQGYIDRLTVRAIPGSARELSATLRVPASQAEAGLTELRKLGRLVEESQNSADITSQYVDLTARLSNARNSEQRLLGLLRERTGDLKDVVEMEREIASVRESIERMEAQRKDLENKVQFVTIGLELTEEYRAELEPPSPSRGTQLRNAAVDGIRTGGESVMNIALFMLQYGPSVVVWFVILAAVVAVVLKLRRIAQRRRT